MKKRIMATALSVCMMLFLMPQSAFAQSNNRYEEVAGTTAVVKDAEVHVYQTIKGGAVTLTDSNSVDNTFTQGIGYREYTATPAQGWVWNGWTYEQLFDGKDLGNRTDFGWGTRYSFTNDGSDWNTPYNGSGKTISVNRLLTTGETTWNKITYNLYANFNPTITASADTGGIISPNGTTEVEYSSNQSYTIRANAGYDIASITVDSKEIADVKDKDTYIYTFDSVIEPHTISVKFEQEKYTVTYTDGVENEEIFKDQTTNNILSGTKTPQFEGTPERDGYVFVAWTPTVEETVTKSQKYTATWAVDSNNNGIPDKDEEKYTVTYTDGVENEEIFKDQTTNNILSGTKTPQFEGTPERDGYVFVAWTPTVEETVTKSQKYTATWAVDSNNNGIPDKDEEKYTVTYTDGVENEEIFKDQTTNNILSGTKTPQFKGTPERDGYVFVAWTPTVEETVTKSQKYTATWAVDSNNNGIPDKDEEKYTVTYTDGVENEEIFKDQTTNNILSGTKTPQFEGTPERDGYVFVAWTPTVEETVTKSQKYTATWAVDSNNNGIPDKDEEKYTVTYTDGVENEEIFKDQTTNNILSGTKTPQFKGTPERDGYVFVAWTPTVEETVTKSQKYTATWAVDSNNNGIPDKDEEKDTPNDSNNGTNNDKTDINKSDSDIVQTGDNTNLALLGTLLILSSVTLTGISRMKIRKSE